MTPKHYELIKSAMLSNKHLIPAHVKWLNEPENKSKIKDFDMRLRWDWLRSTGIFSTDTSRELYSYLNDSHIDTALKQIVKEIS